ncbi:MAG TPA: DUF3597 domain-containing protein [Sphingomicrobium sp.]|nr:DUF3597 domain-containing protein [Sphingomicrobium sp.]
MSIFSKIKNVIFGQRAEARPNPVPEPAGAEASVAPAPEFRPTPETVDVGAVLDNLARSHDGGGNYKTSIVDLLKLLDLDSSLEARKELAEELNVRAGEHGSAEQNIALHRAVMQKLAENGGIVPADLRD